MSTQKAFGALRILFGIVWAVDATLKWMPAIRYHIVDVLTQAQAGQPAIISAWIGLWAQLASIHPVAFGTLIALTESVIALSLITGIASRYTLYFGVPFAFLIWSVPQGFGGPYAAGVTDVDSGIIYLMLFIALSLGQAWSAYTLEPLLKR